MPGHVWVDGRILAAEGPHISAFDRGFELGDGVFETIRAREGRPFELDDHVARLAESAAGLSIPIPADLPKVVREAIAELLAAEGLDAPGVDASIRVTLSRGPAFERGLLPHTGVAPTMVVQAWIVGPPPPGHLEVGLHLVPSRVRRDPGSPLVGLKTVSRAEYVYARLEAKHAGADDALFLTIDGCLAEATTANLFFVSRGELRTPSLDCGILAGTTRAWILRWALDVGLEVVEGRFGPDDLATADEAFLCSSVAGVLPVTRFSGRSIGNGRPGRWTLRARDDREASVRGTSGGG